MKNHKVIITLVVALITAFIFVPQTWSAQSGTDWTVPGDFPTIQAAINSASVIDGDIINVGPGSFTGAIVTKDIEIKGIGGAVINAGIVPPIPNAFPGTVGFWIETSGTGATISHFHFDETVGFPVYGWITDDITVNHNTMINSFQGVSNFAGNRWEIHHNEIIDLQTGCTLQCAGGIGIWLVGYQAATGLVEDNIVSHNTINGTVHLSADTTGGFNAAGISIQAIGPGGLITLNRVSKNKVGLTSDNPAIVDVSGIDLSESGASGVIFDNNIGFNDLREMVSGIGQINLSTAALDNPINRISRNLGNNRGHGLHPSGFVGN